MALRIRRGTEADRTDPTFVPDSGEPIWTIDTKKLYIGDGTTAGGVLVTGEGGGGTTPGIDDTSTTTVLTLTDSLITFSRDIDLDVNDITLGGGVINGIGDISLIGSITTSGTLTANTTLIGSLASSGTGSFGGIVRAPIFDGDLQGSLFGDDSTLIIDGMEKIVFSSDINPTANTLRINNDGTTDETIIIVRGNENRAVLDLVRESTSDLTGNTTAQYGNILFSRNDINGNLVTGSIFGREDSIYIGQSSDGDLSTANKYVVWKNQKLGVGKTTPVVELDVVGDAAVTGSLTAGAMLLSGSIIDTSDSSVITVTPGIVFSSDAVVEGNLAVQHTLSCETLQVTNFQTAGSGTPELASETEILLTAGTRVNITQSPIKMASFTTAERDALSAQNGDLIYNTTDNKFQGYENGAWVNLV